MSAAPLSATHQPDLPRWMRTAAIAGAVGVGLCVVGAFVEREHFFRAWLVAYSVVLGLALGSLVVIMLNYLVGGNWGFVTRRFLEASTRTMPLVALLFLPLLLGMGDLYEWMKPDFFGHEGKVPKHLAMKATYLSREFFIVRAVIYFAIWNLLAYLLNAWSRKQDTAKSPALNDRCAVLSAPGIMLYVLTITFASIDWVMSLEPHWYSTIFMAVFGMSQVLSGFAFAVAVMLLVAPKQTAGTPGHSSFVPVTPPNPEGVQPAGGMVGMQTHAPTSSPAAFVIPTQTLSDLGSLMMAFTMVWAYLAICQFLLIWSGNVPIEITYYIKRGVGPDETNVWTYVSVALIALGFFLPFLLLLNPSIKRDRRRVAMVALWVVFMRVVDLCWVIIPAFDHEEGKGFSFLGVLLYPAALVGVGGVWLAFYLWQIQRVPLLPQYNPAEEAAHHGQAH